VTGRPQHAGKKRDANEPEIVAALRAVGASVTLLDQPCDLLIGYRGANYLFEVKSLSEAKTHKRRTEDQRKRQDEWKGLPITTVYSPEDALCSLGVNVQIGEPIVRGGQHDAPRRGVKE
jgi:hypothetical protein